jgi:hypothetical protein
MNIGATSRQLPQAPAERHEDGAHLNAGIPVADDAHATAKAKNESDKKAALSKGL